MYRVLWFLIETVGSLLAVSCVFRALAWRVRLSPHDPLHRFSIAVTHWLIGPLRARLRPAGAFDTASVAGAAVVALVTALAWSALFGSHDWPVRLVPLALAWLAKWTIYLVAGLVLLQAILSWVNPSAPVAPTLDRLTQPFLEPLRRIVPTVGGIDLTALVLLVLAQVALALVETLIVRLFA